MYFYHYNKGKLIWYGSLLEKAIDFIWKIQSKDRQPPHEKGKYNSPLTNLPKNS